MRNWKTRVLHADRTADRDFQSLVMPTFRGSTTVFGSAEAAQFDWHTDAGYTYGLHGTPTTRELALRIAELEGGYQTVIAPGGQAALTLVDFAFLSAGDHVLLPDSAYGPHRDLAQDVLARLGIRVDYYSPLAGAGVEALFQPATRLVWVESPGSVTMEVADVPAIAGVAHHHGAVVAADNTYSAGVLFDAFAHGVDVTIQALTKYVGGHSDLLLGSVTARDEDLFERIGLTHDRLGMAASPDDCSLALRGLATLGVRLATIEQNALLVANWLAEQPAVAHVLHPALPGSPGHEVWKRDFTGSSGVFSLVLAEPATLEQVLQFVDALELFATGWSWGGVHSLAMPYPDLARSHGHAHGHRLVRLNVGLESVEDLVDDLANALRRAELASLPPAVSHSPGQERESGCVPLL